MSENAEILARLRAGAGLFRLAERGLLEVRGGDRERWLGGMVSNDVALSPGPTTSGCYALRLDRQGRIQADLHVLWRPEAYWLETAREAVPGLAADLDRYIVADDVELVDRSDDFDRIAVEGARSFELLGAVLPGLAEPAPDCGVDAELAGHPVLVAAFGFSGARAAQLFVPAGAGDEVWEALARGAEALGLDGVEASEAQLEVMRIEAGVPALGSELGDDVLPDEAHLGRAVSTSKGCYTGQEVVARLRARGGVKHWMVSLDFDGGPPAAGTRLLDGTRRIGEVTSGVVSPSRGAIGIGFVRREAASAGTRLDAEGVPCRVRPIPGAPEPG